MKVHLTEILSRSRPQDGCNTSSAPGPGPTVREEEGEGRQGREAGEERGKGRGERGSLPFSTSPVMVEGAGGWREGGREPCLSSLEGEGTVGSRPWIMYTTLGGRMGRITSGVNDACNGAEPN